MDTNSSISHRNTHRKGNALLYILVIVTGAFLAGFFYLCVLFYNLSISSATFADISLDSILTRNNDDKIEIKLSPNYPKGYFSRAASVFLNKPRKSDESPDLSTKVLPEASIQPLCESSGGVWFETKGKDLPLLRCQCPFNDWREKNLENVVDRGCDCSMNCIPRDGEFPYFDSRKVSSLDKPKVDVPSGTGTQLIFGDDLSNCSFLSVQDNVCKPCRKDDDCGSAGSGSSSNWLHEASYPICSEGMCRFRRIIYADY